MHLKSLEMQGFKSFPDRIRLQFGQGLTAVVGPNGSGKSNISDAVRWVLGEQSTKTLRGAKMEDVIFSGTEKRRSMGFAQVTLTIDNTKRMLPKDTDDVSVTRKLYRNGDSEYLINGTAVRLKDVRELFMDTGLGRDGYSVIGQGRIAEIVSQKSNERREIFEEAAGISKFRYRKEEAERRLASAEENLLRLRDILSELEGRVEPLRIQSEKAARFLELEGKRRAADISVGVRRLDELKAALRTHDDDLLKAQNEYEQLTNDIERGEEQAAARHESMQACLIQAEALRERTAGKERENADARAQIAVLENEIRHHEEALARLASQKESAAGSVVELDEKIVECRRNAAALQAQIQALALESEEAKNAFASVLRESEAGLSEHEARTEELAALSLRQSEQRLAITSADAAAEQTAQRAAEIAEQDAQLQGLANALTQERDALQQSIRELAAREEEHENRIKGYGRLHEGKAQKLAVARESYTRAENALHAKEQRLQVLSDVEKNMEGYPYSVKQVLTAVKNGRLRGILGTVGQLMTVPDRYGLAIETALGAAVQNLVVEHEDAAKRGIAFLKEQNAGRATFLPVTTVQGKALEDRELGEHREGVEGFAHALVQCEPRFEGIIRFLLGRVAVVEDIDIAASLAKRTGYRFRIVTLDGQVVNAGGSFTGGSAGKSAGVFSRRNEMEALERAITQDTERLGRDRAALSTLQAETDKLSLELEAQREQGAILAQDRIRFEAEGRRIEALLAQRAEQFAGLDHEKARLAAQAEAALCARQEAERTLAVLKESIAQAEAALTLSAASRASLHERRETLSQTLSDMRLKELELSKDMDAQNAQSRSLEEAKERIAASSVMHEDEEARLRTEIATCTATISSLRLNIASGEEAVRQAEEDVRRVMQERETHEQGITELRVSIRAMSDAREKFSREAARLSERRVAVQNNYDAIISDFWERYGLTKSEADKEAHPIEDMLAAQRELTELRNKIKALGTVNLSAIEEYQEVSERYEFLSCQLADVETAKKELERLISELTATIQERFRTSFEEINRQFGSIFRELFEGGKGELLLTEPENVLESGIEIRVAPPGKIIKNLTSLSGGEQAFVAIAIYFAILKVRPAPFCILDEIEAALDDVNVVKYAAYLRRFIDTTQFILITHRRGTMEEADVLYGVTMQEEGVSKLLEMPVKV